MSNEQEILPPVGAHAQPPVAVRPNWRFMWSHAAHPIALGFGSGLSRFAPGTFGTLWAWLVFVLLQPHLSDRAWLMVIALSLPLGWWACTMTARDLRLLDPGCIVWDEVVAFWIVLWIAAPTGFWPQLWAFVLFRFFDAAKPGPVRWADKAFKGTGWRGGFGIMFDDLVAALCALLVIAVWRH